MLSLTRTQGAANTASWIVALIAVIVYTSYMKYWKYRTTLFLMQLLVFGISALDIILVGVAKDAFWGHFIARTSYTHTHTSRIVPDFSAGDECTFPTLIGYELTSQTVSNPDPPPFGFFHSSPFLCVPTSTVAHRLLPIRCVAQSATGWASACTSD